MTLIYKFPVFIYIIWVVGNFGAISSKPYQSTEYAQCYGDKEHIHICLAFR